MRRYRIEQQEFDAIHFCRTSLDFTKVTTFVHPVRAEVVTPRHPNGKSVCTIHTEVKITVQEGDWVCRSVDGRLFTMPNAAFRDGIFGLVKDD